MPTLHLATFRADVTPPIGHPMCGGLVKPSEAIDDPLEALGVVLLGMGRPIVLCALDWCGLRNAANWRWREALADAVQTTPDCVAVQCMHPHNTPFADPEAEKLLAAARGPGSLDLKFFEQAMQSCADAARKSLARTRRWTHAGVGQGKVERVASNRRVLGDDGKVKYVRFSTTKNPKARAAPEGLIDPFLRTLSFWDGDKPLAALSYYATHPMSYYGDGRITADFCGHARRKMQDDEKEVFQIYFTGCAGNVAAGKYNDGAHENRPILRDHVYAGMTAAWKNTERFPVDRFDWRVEPVLLPPRTEASFGIEESQKVLEDDKATAPNRANAGFQISWLRRKERPIEISCLDLGKARVLHLPGEPFVEFQLFAQKLRTDISVLVAGYGDGGPGYLPMARAYEEGGYEPTAALASPKCQEILEGAITKLLGKKDK